MRLPLVGGSYTTRSIIASAQRCINLFPETNPREALVPMTHYQRPGLRHTSECPIPGWGRGLYRASNGSLYAVVGQKLYYIDSHTFAFTPLGTIATNNQDMASMVDNGVDLVVVDNSLNGGWTSSLTTFDFNPITDITGTFQGATKVDYIDTFLIFGPVPPIVGSTAWISSLSNQVQFSGLSVGGKTDYPDPLQTLIVNRHEIVLLGALKSEIWYDAGNAQFPFAELPGAYIEHGVVAPYSVASSDISVFWLTQDLQGQGVVFRQRGYNTTRISNHALEYALRKVVSGGGTLRNCTSYTYQQDGHYFYVLNVPSGDQTWVFDDAVGEPTLAWHQRAWTDGDGVMHRDRLNSVANAYDKIWGQDWETGALYAVDPDYYVDTVNGVDYPITYLRTFPHIGRGYDEQGRLIDADGRQVNYQSFMLDIETGTIPLVSGQEPLITARYSDDRGKTFSGSVNLVLGATGEYLTWPTFKGGLGKSRDRLWEVQWSGNGQTALNGAWVDGRVLHD